MPRRLLILSGFALAALAVLIGLGLWQLGRKAWKEDLIARLDARTKQRPVPLDFDAVRRAGAQAWEFRLVEAAGRFRHGEEVHVWTPRREGSAWTVFTPLELDGQAARYPRVILVARGFVPDGLKDPASRLEGQVAGTTTLVGRLRVGETPGPFSPAADLAKNQWHVRDAGAMARLLAEAFVRGSASGDAAAAEQAILPLYLEVQGEPPPGGWPKPQLSPLNLKNDHLGYALTWFGLAGALVGVYGAFMRREWRDASP